MTGAGALEVLVARADLDELVLEADARASREEFDGLVALRDRCDAATRETGRQLWPAARYAEYRLALDAPAELAASVVLPGAGRFTLGPLTEVVAQNHRFGELADHLDPTVAGIVAQERVIRGEDLEDDPPAGFDEAEVPGRTQPWEPAYTIPTYRRTDRLDGVIAAPDAQPDRVPDAPADRAPAPAEDLLTGRTRDLDPVRRALRELVAPWERESTGTVTVMAVPGDLTRAFASLADAPDTRPVAPVRALLLMAAAAASGGTHGRRRGGAAGRTLAWWAAATFVDLSLPTDPDELEFRLEDLRFHELSRSGDDTGWRLHLAVEDPTGGWTAVVDAHDPVAEDVEV